MPKILVPFFINKNISGKKAAQNKRKKNLTKKKWHFNYNGMNGIFFLLLINKLKWGIYKIENNVEKFKIFSNNMLLKALIIYFLSNQIKLITEYIF